MDIIAYATQALTILERDKPVFDKCERYFRGDHDYPYMPDSAEAEYRALARRAITNWCDVVVQTPLQAMYVDNFRKGEDSPLDGLDESPEWKSWQRSRLDGRQQALYSDALKFGPGYILTERVGEDVISKPLSARRTVALFEDPAADLDPVAAMYVRRYPTEEREGQLWLWDEDNKYILSYGLNKAPELIANETRAHGAGQCPVTRFAAFIDTEGRTWGVIAPMVNVQDRINQTVFDLLVAQTYSSFEVRTVTGMAPPLQMRYNEELGIAEPVIGADGKPIPDRLYLNASRFMFAESPDAKFSSLPGGNLQGFIDAAELAIRHLAALSQTPPHFLLGQIANISAEALEAAETALSRKVEGFRTSFGESWERVFRITSHLLGDGEVEDDDFSGEVVWRDLGVSSMNQVADALGKLKDQLDIPAQGLWPMIPKVRRAQLAEWRRLYEEADVDRRALEEVVGMGRGPAVAPAVPTRFGSEAVNGNTNPTG